MWKWIAILCVLFSMTLKGETKVLAFSGSNREASVNRKLLLESVSIARKLGAKVEVINLKDLPIPFYDGDIESKDGLPENAKKIRGLMIQSQVILIASPEYNGSIPAVLKNVLDWASRDNAGKPSREAFKGKTFIIMSASPGSGGGARALEHLRAIIENVGGTVSNQQFVLKDAYNAFDEQGNLKDLNLINELQQIIQKVIK